MRCKFRVLGCILMWALLPQSALRAQAVTPEVGPTQAVCDQIYAQYRLRAEGCAPITSTLAQRSLDAAQIAADAVAVAVTVPRVRVQPLEQGTEQGNTTSIAPYLAESALFFPSGGSKLDADALEQIERVAQILNTPVMQEACLSLIGHSDSSGGAAANKRLSEERAEKVASILRNRLYDGRRIQIVRGMGEEQPLPGLPASARENRRVEIWAKTCKAW